MVDDISSASLTRDELHARLHEIERQLLGLQRLLAEDHEALPSAPFHALELRIGAQCYLLPVAPVREIVQVVWPSPLPESPPWILGTFRYGPLLLPMVDLKHRLLGVRTKLTLDLTLAIVDSPKPIGILTPVPEGLVEVRPDAVSAPDPEISQSPWIIGTVSSHSEGGAHLLSPERLGRAYVLTSA